MSAPLPPLEDRAARFTGAILGAVSRWQESVDARVDGPLAEALRAATSAHERLVREAGLEDGAETAELWTRLVRYRDGVREGVLRPLATRLHEVAPARTLTETLRETLQTIDQAAAVFGPGEQWPDPPSLYLPAEPDRGVSAWVKGVVRARRAIGAFPRHFANRVRRVAGRDPVPLPEATRVVPAAALARYHAVVRIGPRLARTHATLQRRAAARFASLATAAADWAEDLLDLEQGLDDVGHHLPAGWDTGAESEVPAGPEDLAEGRRIAEALHHALTAALQADPVPIALADSEAETDALVADLAIGGTPLLPLRQRYVPEPGESAGGKALAAGVAWADWHRRARGRFDLALERLRLRSESLRLEDELLRRVAHQVLGPVRQTFGAIGSALRSMAAEAEQACAGGAQGLVGKLAALEARGVRIVADAVGDLRGLASAEATLSEVGAAEQRELDTLIAALPEEVEVIDLPDPQNPSPTRGLRTVYPREAAEAAYAPPLSQHLRRKAESLRLRVLELWESTDRVVHIIEYNLESAIDELSADRSGDGDPVVRARELAEGGFRRAAETLDELETGLQTPWHDLAKALFRVVEEDWAEFRRRLRGRDEPEDRLEEARAALARRIRRRLQATRERVVRGWAWVRPRAAGLVARISGLVSLGRSAVGADQPTEEERLATLDAVQAVSRKIGTLPLVYRRLFAFEPVRRRQLLAGRAAALAEARSFVTRWREGDPTGTLVVTGLPGVGRTSLLEVLRAELENDEVPVHRVTLDRAARSEGELVRRLTQALGLEADSLEELPAAVAARTGEPVVCLVDDFETIFRQTLNGARLAERVLATFRATEETVCWVVAVSQAMWPIFQSESRAAGRNLRTILLEPLDRDAVEAAVLLRHQWSGMPLRFAVPPDLSAIQRRRLRRARSPEAREAILHEAFFDRLTRASMGDVGLALLYWLQAADFDAEAGAVTVHPVSYLSFRFLGGLTLTHTMTLRTFLIHGALSVAEHQEIFRLGAPERSAFFLEHLLDLGLLEPASGDGHGRNGASIDPALAYRIRPAFRPAVIAHLRHANMLPRGAA